MKNLYVEINNELNCVGYIEQFEYDNETFIKVERVGMFTQVYSKKEFESFMNEHTFIIED